MFYMKYLFYSIVLHLINSAPRLNLYYTDPVSVSESDVDNLQHNCLYVINPNTKTIFRGTPSYCMGEFPSKFVIETNDLFSTFTFGELSKKNITSQELFVWSAPLDIIERYQFYLDQLSKSFDDLIMEKEVFYNCTLPRFGPKCQYQLEYDITGYSSLYQFIAGVYKVFEYQPTSLTCYTHLQCNRGPFPSCLDWTEICDGVEDCHDGGLDEQHCWQLEINQCNENEFRCKNGQCIPKSFYADKHGDTYDCADGSDDVDTNYIANHLCEFITISFRCEDILCKRNGLTSSCVHERQHLLVQSMFSSKDESVSDECWSAFKCALNISTSNDPTCICSYNQCVKIIESECPDPMFILPIPVLFSHIYFVYRKNISKIFQDGLIQYPYLCSTNSYYDDYFLRSSKILINNLTCGYHYNTLLSFFIPTHFSHGSYIFNIHKELWRYNQIFNYTSTFCNRSNMHQCANSIKCISIHRRNNKVNDCPQSDDENPGEILDATIVYPLDALNNYWLEYNKRMIKYTRKNISFQTICNGYTELEAISINGQDETDETECDSWACNNIYTRCNDLWNCFNGEDELNCDLSPKLDCPSDSHICVSPDTYQLICLSISKANDGHVDCLGGTDEPRLCRRKYDFEYPDEFYCVNRNSTCIHGEKLCDFVEDCDRDDDENFCVHQSIGDWKSHYCAGGRSPDGLTEIDKVLCKPLRGRQTDRFVFFSVTRPDRLSGVGTKNIENQGFLKSSIIAKSRQYEARCHRGLDLRVWLNATNSLPTCLCPPNFYGNMCQYQNQRVILSIKFRSSSNSWRRLFAIVISLVDDSDEHTIHSFKQFSYLTRRNCDHKFNVYLLYSTRPKNSSKTYSIRIDIYEKFSLKFRGSLLFPIPFQFLPVHHLSFIVDIPREDNNDQKSLNNHCGHGKSMKYSNNETISFCHCNKGWTGRYCNTQLNCTCSSDSLCIGLSANNRSICICRPNKWGPRCLLNTVCQVNNNSMCKNNGQCISDDEYIEYNENSFYIDGYTCLCPQGYFGERCEYNETKLLVSFGKDIILSESIFIHFFRVNNEDVPTRSTTFVTIPIKKDSLTIYWSRTFNLAFIEILINNYYLIVVQKRSPPGSIIKKGLISSDRCLHIREIFNETFLQWHPIRQIKYYHLVCQNYSFNLSCFYDDVHLCYCYIHEQKRLANCFEFDHNMTMNCLGKSECQNQGQCFQDDPDCPERSMCLCKGCFYGRLCQFHENGFDLSLDGILGYHIRPNISIKHQPILIKISMTLTTLFLFIGLMNGILSLITFNSNIIREVGCGLYLFGSSITTLLTTMIFGFKYWILIFSQMGIIKNNFFLTFQCYSIDFILRICLNMDQWLNACVAVERAYTTTKGAAFSKKKSKQIAKVIIMIILIFNIGTSFYT